MEMEFHSQPSSHTPCIPSLGLSQAPSEEPCLEWPALSVLLSGLYHPPPTPCRAALAPLRPVAGTWSSGSSASHAVHLGFWEASSHTLECPLFTGSLKTLSYKPPGT